MSGFDIVPRRRPTLIQALQATLKRVQERERLTPDDPALLRLKESILRSIAELEVQTGRDSEKPAA